MNTDHKSNTPGEIRDLWQTPKFVFNQLPISDLILLNGRGCKNQREYAIVELELLD